MDTELPPPSPCCRAAQDARRIDILLRVLSKLRGYHSLCVTASGPYSYAGWMRARVKRPLSPPDSSTLPQCSAIFILRCGPKDHDLLVPQRLDRVDSRRPARRDVAGGDRGQRER